MSNDSSGSFFNAFLLGAAIGFVVGVLSAPRSGQEMRDEINERTRGIREQMEHLAERVRQQLNRESDSSGGGEGSKSN